MKKIKILSLFLICCLMCSCAPEQSQDFTISQYDSESRIEINFEDSSAPSSNESRDINNSSQVIETSEEIDISVGKNTGTLLVKEKKYAFQENDLIILDVTNESDTNISVTITGTYLDESGNELAREAQTFDQFSSGYRKYFLFNPEIPFSKFTYSIETALSSGPFYAKDLSFSFKGLLEGKMSITEQEMKGDYKLYPTLVAEYEFQLKGSTELKPEGIFILFNDNDQIVAIEHLGLQKKISSVLYYTRQQRMNLIAHPSSKENFEQYTYYRKLLQLKDEQKANHSLSICKLKE